MSDWGTTSINSWDELKHYGSAVLKHMLDLGFDLFDMPPSAGVVAGAVGDTFLLEYTEEDPEVIATTLDKGAGAAALCLPRIDEHGRKNIEVSDAIPSVLMYFTSKYDDREDDYTDDGERRIHAVAAAPASPEFYLEHSLQIADQTPEASDEIPPETVVLAVELARSQIPPRCAHEPVELDDTDSGLVYEARGPVNAARIIGISTDGTHISREEATILTGLTLTDAISSILSEMGAGQEEDRRRHAVITIPADFQFAGQPEFKMLVSPNGFFFVRDDGQAFAAENALADLALASIGYQLPSRIPRIAQAIARVIRGAPFDAEQRLDIALQTARAYWWEIGPNEPLVGQDGPADIEALHQRLMDEVTSEMES